MVESGNKGEDEKWEYEDEVRGQGVSLKGH